MGERTVARRSLAVLLVLVGVMAGWTAASLLAAKPTEESPVEQDAASTEPAAKSKRWVLVLAGLVLGVALVVLSIFYRGIDAPWWGDVKPVITLLVACAALLIAAIPEKGAPVSKTLVGLSSKRSPLTWVAIGFGLFALIDSFWDAVSGLSQLL